MTDTDRTRPSLKEFDAYADRNGQDFGTASPLDVGIPSRTQADLKGNPDGTAEAARIASGTPGQDATDQTEAETPPENLRRISDPSSTPSPTPSGPDAAAAEAIERATAAVGSEDAPRQGGRDGQ